VTSLDRKLWRDLWNIRGQAIAIAAVMACGIAIFVMAMSAMESLQLTQASYYDRYRFADLFAMLKRAPLSLIHRIEELPGVLAAQTRISKDVTLDIPELREPASARLLSLPEDTRGGLNWIHLRAGRFLEPRDVDNVLVSEAFAKAWSMGPGDSCKVIMNGRLRRLHIVGVALSPEYVYQIRPGDLIPDPSRFAIFWMNRKALEAAFDMEGAFNDLSLQLMPDTNVQETIRRVDDLIKTFGGFGSYARRDQLSNRFLSDEIENLRHVGVMIPSVFLLVAAFLLNLVVSRIIGTQREQIAALKALGYSKLSIGWHYLKLAFLIVGFGWGAGVLAGGYMGHGMTVMYTQFFSFPILQYHLTPRLVLTAAGIALLAGFFGTAGSVRRAVVLPPAEAMRPEPPAEFGPTILERLGLARFFSNTTRMVLRHMERTPVKSAMSILGIALAVGVLILGRCTADGIFYMIDVVFTLQRCEHLTLTFVEPRGRNVLQEIEHLPGVMSVEPFRSVPARLRFEHRWRRTAIVGLQEHAMQYQLVDDKIRRIDVPKGGLLLSEKLAQLIGARPGDSVTVEVLEGSRPTRQIVVSGLAKEFLGTTPYMEISSLNSMMREGSLVSGVYVRCDSKLSDELYKTLKKMPFVAGVSIKEAALHNFRKTLADTLLFMVMFQTIFSMVIAFGVVYNAARLAVSERSRELASLRVLGFTRTEISAILLGELAILTFIGIPVGLVLGHFGSYGAISTFDTELFRLPFHLNPSTYGLAVVIVLIAAIISGLIVRRKLDHLDLIAVLKTKE
jgi:putative ABC transport system permease protein